MLAKIFTVLLNSSPCLRANSVRRKLFLALHETLCNLRTDFPECRAALDALGRTSAFDQDEGNFQAALRRAIELIPMNRQLLAGLAERVTQQEIEHKLQLAVDAIAMMVAKQRQREEFTRSLESVLSEVKGEIHKQTLNDALARI